MTPFRIGQRIVCVAEFTAPRKYKEIKPVVDMTYTVRGFLTEDGQTGIYLEEIVNPKYKYKGGYREAAYGMENFRAVQYPPATAEILSKFQPTDDRADVEVRKDETKPTEKNDQCKP